MDNYFMTLSTSSLYRANFKSQKRKKCKSTILCTQKVQKVGKVDKLYKVVNYNDL